MSGELTFALQFQKRTYLYTKDAVWRSECIFDVQNFLSPKVVLTKAMKTQIAWCS